MYTKEQKALHFQALRNKWKAAKIAIEEDEEKIVEEIYKLGLTVSPIGFYICKCEMQEAGLSGTPYIDAKTYQGWKASGFRVKKGERAFGNGIAWVDCSKEDEEESIVYPKTYALFHKSQVEEL